MPITIAQMLQGMATSGEGGANAVNQKRSDQRKAALEKYLKGSVDANGKYQPGVEAAAENAAGDRNIDKAKGLLGSGALPEGSGLNLSAQGGVGITRGINPMAQQQQGAKQAQAFIKSAQGAYKPINDQLDAAQSTVDALNQGNATSDKIALINEARIAAGQGGSRAISHLVDVLSGGKTSAEDFQGKLNWVMNTPNIPTMQPSQRDAIRESVFARLPQLSQMHSQVSSQLAQQGPAMAPQADTAKLLGSFADPVQQKLQGLGKMQKDYMAQRSKMPGQAISSPSTANDNPTTVDKLKSFLGIGPSAQQQATPAVAPATPPDTGDAPVDHSDAIAQELARRAQAALNQPQKSQDTQGQ